MPDKQHNDRAYGCADEARALVWSIPTDRLANPGCKKRSTNAENRREQETGRIVGSRREPASNEARYKTDQDYPDNAHMTSQS